MDILIYISVLLTLVVLLVVLRARALSFAAQRSWEYAGLGPDFDLRRHLSGALESEGLIFGPTGRMTSRFAARMTGTWDDTGGLIEEELTFEGGARQTRAWRVAIDGARRFTAGADDVKGLGHGTITGPTVRFRYRIVLPADAGGHTLDVIDWMYLTDQGTIINRSQYRKFGVLVAELIATIRPPATGGRSAPSRGADGPCRVPVEDGPGPAPDAVVDRIERQQIR